MGNIFEVKDYCGVKVYCTEDTWNNHIVSGHPMMEENLSSVLHTIQSPDVVIESHDSNPPLDYRVIYVKKELGASYYSFAPYTKVVVSILGGSGETITAYPSKNEHGGGTKEVYRASDL